MVFELQKNESIAFASNVFKASLLQGERNKKIIILILNIENTESI